MRFAQSTTLKKKAPALLAALAIYLFALPVVLSNIYGSKSSRNQKPVAGSPSGTSSLDACALIQNPEIESVQGLPVQQAQPTSQKHGDLHISQCYYTAISADGSKNLSVFLQVIQLEPKSARRNALREFWEEKFARESKEKTRDEKDEEEAINPPLHVPGIGEEAFWLGSSRGGALFVLKKNRVVRVSVGDEDAKVQIEKSKMLAKKALARLG